MSLVLSVETQHHAFPGFLNTWVIQCLVKLNPSEASANSATHVRSESDWHCTGDRTHSQGFLQMWRIRVFTYPLHLVTQQSLNSWRKMFALVEILIRTKKRASVSHPSTIMTNDALFMPSVLPSKSYQLALHKRLSHNRSAVMVPWQLICSLYVKRGLTL